MPKKINTNQHKNHAESTLSLTVEKFSISLSFKVVLATAVLVTMIKWFVST